MTDVTEVYLVGGRSSRCLVCNPSPELLVDSLRDGTFRLCADHLLRAHVHGNTLDGERSLRPLDPDGRLSRRRRARS